MCQGNSRKLSVVVAVATLLINIGCIFEVVSIMSRQWVVANGDRMDNIEFGLWKTCSIPKEKVLELSLMKPEERPLETPVECLASHEFVVIDWGTHWVAGMRVTLVMALVTTMVACVLLDVYLVYPTEPLRIHTAPVFVALCCSITALANLMVGNTIILSKQRSDALFSSTKLGWSLDLSLTADFFMFIAVPLLFVDYHRLLMLRCGKKFASPRGPTARVEYEMANRDTNSPRTPGNHYPPPNNNQLFNLPEAGVNAKPYPAQPPNPRQDNRRETQHSRWPVANQGGPHNEAYIREGFPPITSPRQGTSLPPRDATC